MQTTRSVKVRIWTAEEHPETSLPTLISCIIEIMIEVNIPGRGKLTIEYLVMDVNGTLALDGILMDGVVERITSLRNRLDVHLLTADTHGGQAVIDQLLGFKAVRIQPGNELEQKAAYVRQLGPERVIAIGQGANDAGMLRVAALGICVMSVEGLALETLDQEREPGSHRSACLL